MYVCAFYFRIQLPTNIKYCYIMLQFVGFSKKTDFYIGPTYSGLQFWGLMLTHRKQLYRLLFTLGLIYNITQYIELWRIRKDHRLAIRNLSLTMFGTTAVCKMATFVLLHKSWSDLVEHLNSLEQFQLSQNDQMTNKIITEYTKKSRRFNQFYNVVVIATILSKLSAPLLKYYFLADYKNSGNNGTITYPELLSSWVPFDKTTVLGYSMVTLEQTIICFFAGCITQNYDCNYVTLMSFFAGQLKLLCLKCEQLFVNSGGSVTDDEALKRIRECHYHHLYIVKYAADLNFLLSPIMFVHVIIYSLMIGAKVIEFSTEITGNVWHIWTLENVISLTTQFFLYCWHSNEVLYGSSNVDSGVYSSMWWSQNARMRRSLLLLGGQLRKSIEFTAGPFTKLDLNTFLTIIKGSYSYYTLLNQKKK